MGNDIKGIVKPLEKNGKVFTHQDTSSRGVSQYHCSTFIKNQNILVKGEYDNKHVKRRNAMILLIDCDNGNIIGESSILKLAKQKVEERHL